MNTPFEQEKPRGPGLFVRLRASFITGLIVIAPVGLTIWLIWSVVGWIDGFVLPFVPWQYQPDKLIQTYLGLDQSVQIFLCPQSSIFPTNLLQIFLCHAILDKSVQRFLCHAHANTEPMTATLQAILAGSCC